MTEKESIFLSTGQALRAVCLDFMRYEPQTMLFSEIMRVISGGDAIIRRESGKGGVWIGTVSRSKMNWLNDEDLGEFMCRALDTYDPDLKTMVSVCSRVFQTRVYPDTHPETGHEGIRIETGMENFTCRQCGNCCKSLDYHDAVTFEDVALWEKTQRLDILDHVGRYTKPDGTAKYRIWITPGAADLEDICPFLQHLPEENRWICTIHNVKPSICRNYPVSRKHGLMTGCPGFNLNLS